MPDAIVRDDPIGGVDVRAVQIHGAGEGCVVPVHREPIDADVTGTDIDHGLGRGAVRVGVRQTGNNDCFPSRTCPRIDASLSPTQRHCFVDIKAAGITRGIRHVRSRCDTHRPTRCRKAHAVLNLAR